MINSAFVNTSKKVINFVLLKYLATIFNVFLKKISSEFNIPIISQIQCFKPIFIAS